MKTKQKIYEAAKKLFLENGYTAVTNKQIADMADVTHGLIRYYFKDKKNIAVTILKENYQIISNYLRNFIDSSADPFLFFITIDNLLDQIKNKDEKLCRFLFEISHEYLIDNIYTGNPKNDILALIKKMRIPEEDIEKEFRVFLAIFDGVGKAIQNEIYHGLNFTYKEYFEKMVHLFVFLLDFKWDESIIQDYILRSNEVCEQFFKKYPHLIDTKNYLYKSEFSKRTITEDLLNL